MLFKFHSTLGFFKRDPRPRNFPVHMGKCQKWVQDPKKKIFKIFFYSSELGARRNVKNTWSHKEYIRNDYLDLKMQKKCKNFLIFGLAKNF